MGKPRAIVRLTLTQLQQLWLHGVDVLPNPHAWVTDESIEQALALGLSDDLSRPHTPLTPRHARIASFVRELDAGCPRPFKFYAELYFRGTALRLKIVDGAHRWRAMQFRRSQMPVAVHIFGQYEHVRGMVPPECLLEMTPR